HVRRPRSGQVCEFPPRREQRKEPRSGPDFGSPFFGLRFFGEAKKGRSAAGPRPGQTKLPEKNRAGAQRPLAPALSPEGRGRSGSSVQRIPQRTHHAINLRRRADEGRRELYRVPAVAHIKALL